MERAQFLLDLALKQRDEGASFRLMLYAVYSCRGMFELMFEAADKQEVKGLTRDALETQISPTVLFYALIERIRIHDFHRFRIVPPNPKLSQLMVGGPIKLRAQKGSAVVTVSSGGASTKTTGGSHVSLQRPLLCQDGNFFDEESGKYVTLDQVLSAFLAKTSDVVVTFEKLMS
jgi:hypothetical protein